MSRRSQATLAGVVILLLCGAHYWSIRALGFLGHDTLPIVATSIVESPHDLVRIFSEPHVGEPFWSLFYRPLLKLSFSLDHALFGLDARGYHATTVLQLSVLSAALFALAYRTAGFIAAWTAVLVFLLHPVHVEVLPVLARRGDVLCGAFLLLALYTQLSPGALAARRPRLLPFLFTLAAVLSKETALVLPVLTGAAAWIWSPRLRLPERLRAAFIASLGPAAAVVIAAIARAFALGSLGGHETASFASIARSGEIATMLLLPQPVLLESTWVQLALGMGMGLAAAAAASARWLGRGTSPDANRAARSAAFAAVVTATLIAIHAYTGKTSPWYLLLPACAWALFLGSVVSGLVRLLGRGVGTPARFAAGAALASLAMFSLAQARLSPILFDYPEWPAAAESRDAYLSGIEPRIRAAPPGTILRLEPFPNRVRSTRPESLRGPSVRSAAIFRRDSLETWLRLTHPERNIRVRRSLDRSARNNVDGILILAHPRVVPLQ